MLSKEYGRKYLNKIAEEYPETQLADTDFQEHLLKFSEKIPDNIHPEYLGLCADVCIAAKKANEKLSPEDFPKKLEFEEKARIFVNRSLRYVNREVKNTVYALSVCRHFDTVIYFVVGEHLNEKHFLTMSLSEDTFNDLKSLPFVWSNADKGSEHFRIQDFLRHLLNKENSPIVIESHRCLEKYYRKENSLDNIEAIYHANRFDQKRSVQEWNSLFENRLFSGEFEYCESLMFLRNEMQINENLYLSEMLRLEGDYFSATYRNEDAELSFKKAMEILEDNIQILHSYHSPDWESEN